MVFVSVVLPARNEEMTIGYVLDEVIKQTERLKNYAFEIIVAADHCSDKTELIGIEKRVRVVHNEKRVGKGNAICAGLSHAKGTIVIMLDTDGSHDPADFPKFLEAIANGAHFVIGSRAKGGSDEYEPVRLFGNAFFTLLASFLFGISLTDFINGYKAFRREVFNDYQYCSSGFEIEIELLYSALLRKFRIVEVPSHERARMGGQMKSSTLRDGLRFFFAIIKWGCKYKFQSIPVKHKTFLSSD